MSIEIQEMQENKDAISVAVGGKAVTNATFPKQSW